jgi:hypothetical protein
MAPPRDDVAARRRLEDILIACRHEREWLEHQEMINRGKVRGVLADARAVGITMRDIAALTGISRQTLHAWMNMLPIPEIHYGLAGPRPHSIAEAALRTMGEQPARDWLPDEVRAAMPADWPTGDEAAIAAAMESLARARRIWDGESAGYRIAPPS